MIEQFEFDVIKFQKEVDEIVCDDISYMDSILHWCEKNNIEIETLVPIIKKDPNIKAKLFEYAEKNNFIKKSKVEDL
jgi:hypothetical protein